MLSMLETVFQPVVNLGCVWQDDCKAARLLAEHGELKEAVTRLMSSMQRAAKADQTTSPTLADKDTLSLLQSYCSSLASPWATQQVIAAPTTHGFILLMRPCMAFISPCHLHAMDCHMSALTAGVTPKHTCGLWEKPQLREPQQVTHHMLLDYRLQSWWVAAEGKILEWRWLHG